jgi:hypothetical protein
MIDRAQGQGPLLPSTCCHPHAQPRKPPLSSLSFKSGPLVEWTGNRHAMSRAPVHENLSQDKIAVEPNPKLESPDTVHLETREPDARATTWYSKFWQKDVDPSLVKEALDKYGDGTAGIDPAMEKKLIRKIDWLILPV